MSLKYIVPTVGLLAAASAPLSAADVGGVSIDGYVDSILEIISYDDGSAPSVDADGEPDDLEIDFTAAAQLEVGYEIGDAVNANIEIYYEDGADSFTLEQAYVEWAINDKVSLAGGRFHNHLGWEGLDAPELYRVNTSIMFNALTGIDVDGAAVGIDAGEKVDVGIYLVDSFYGENVATGGDKENADLGIGAAVTFDVDGVGTFDVDFVYDIGASLDENGEIADILHIGVNGEITSLREDNGLLFAFDFIYQDYDATAGMGLMAMGNWKLQTDTPMSVTLMLSYLEPNDDDDLGGTDDEDLEIALALLTNPTKDENFGLNVEAQYISRGDEGLDGAAGEQDEFGIYVEMLGVIP